MRSPSIRILMMTLPQASLFERLLLVIGRRSGFRVEGNSMAPTLSDGDLVLVRPQRSVRTGDIVLVSHPYKASVKILKRVVGTTQNGDLILAGDNPAESTDSRTFGAVPIQSVIGKVTSRLR